MKATTPPRLQFLGATDTVTGSRFLLAFQGRRILVDCGLFQGFKHLRDRNRIPLPVPPWSISDVLPTHGHLDHSGYLPAPVRKGFTSRIHATAGTAELCTILLPDSGHLQEEEARYAEHRGSSTHHPPRTLYTSHDALAALEHFTAHDFDTPLPLNGGIEATFLPAGHIIGAAQLHINLGGHSIHFTGDLGRPDDPLMHPPRALESTQVLVTESTYGNRTHPAENPETILADVVNRVTRRNGVVLIAAFAVGRAETILLHLFRLLGKGKIRSVPCYLNSPMAIDASFLYRRFREEHRLAAPGAGLSAHADSDDLIGWMRTSPTAPRMTYITHGEPEASDALRVRIKRELGWNARVPKYLETINPDKPR